MRRFQKAVAIGLTVMMIGFMPAYASATSIMVAESDGSDRRAERRQQRESHKADREARRAEKEAKREQRRAEREARREEREAGKESRDAEIKAKREQSKTDGEVAK